MKTKTIVLIASVVAAPAFAQVQISVQLPTITFSAPPPLVVVQPGVQVVEDYDEEVYFVDSWYWVRRDGRWYRTKDHRGGWVVVDRGVPATIVQLPPGKYRRYKQERHRDDDDKPGRGKGEGKKHGKHR